MFCQCLHFLGYPICLIRSSYKIRKTHLYYHLQKYLPPHSKRTLHLFYTLFKITKTLNTLCTDIKTQLDFTKDVLPHTLTIQRSFVTTGQYSRGASLIIMATTYIMLNIFYLRTHMGFHVEPDPDIRRSTCCPLQI